jgi:dolichol kinase
MIGNLVFVVPFFTSGLYPVAVAAPFVLITFLATPYSPFKTMSLKLKELVAITEKGHHLGLVFYSISYTILAVFFASEPYIMAAGVLPMAYGDSVASIVGEKHGKRKYKILADKSLEGSLVMLLVSLLSLIVSLVFFSAFYSLVPLKNLLSALMVAIVATAAEGFSPLGFDNLTVPLLCAPIFVLLSRGL